MPKAYIEQNQLREGAQLELRLEGANMTGSAPRKPRYKLKELLAAMPGELPCVEGWDAMTPAGKEVRCWVKAFAAAATKTSSKI